jgi:hypothetical protein
VSADPVHILGTGLTGGDDRSDLCELKLLQLPCFQVVCMHSSRGSCIGSGGVASVQGELFVVFELLFGGLRSVCALCLSFVFLSDVSSRCPCLRGPRLVFFK